MSDTAPRERLRQVDPTVVAVAVALVPVLVAIVRSVASDWMPVGDNALVEMRSRDVFTTDHVPLLGTWSSASLTAGTDLNHPGPLLFDLLAIPVRLFGGPAGVAIGVGLVNAAAIVLAVVAATRAAGRAAGAITAAAATMLAWTLGSALLTDPWNPHVVVLPCLAMLVCAWAVGSGRHEMLPWLVAVASLCLQVHLGYAYLVPATLVAAVAGLVVVYRRRWRIDPACRSVDLVRLRRSGVIAVVTGLVLWAQPIVEQFTGPGKGNLARILSSTGSDGPTVGPSLGARIFGSVVVWPPWWSRSSFTTAVPDTPYEADGISVDPPGVPGAAVAVLCLVVLVAVLGLLAVRSHRRLDRPALSVTIAAGWACVVALGSLVIMPIGALGLTAHQMRWLWAIGAFVLVGVVVAVARAIGHDRRWALGALGVTVLFAAVNLPEHVQPAGPERDRGAQPVARSLSSQLSTFDPDGRVLFDVSNLRFAESYSTVVMSAMQREGVEFAVAEEGMVRQLGESRRADGSERWRMWVFEGRDALEPPVAGEVVAFHSPVAAVELDELLALEAEQVAALETVGIVLTPAGEAAIDDGRFGIDGPAFADAAPAELVRSGVIAGLVVVDGLVLDEVGAELFVRATELRLRITTTTAAVVVEPIEASSG